MKSPASVARIAATETTALEEVIRLRAYEMYLKRAGGTQPAMCGDALSDWLAAERDVLASQNAGKSGQGPATMIEVRGQREDPDVVVTRGRRGARPMGSARRARARDVCTFTSPLPELRAVRQRGSLGLPV